MHNILKLSTVAIMFVTTGCTHLATLPETRSKLSTDALVGIPYALPMLQYSLKVKRTLESCPKEFTIKIGSKTSDAVVLFDPTLKFGVKLEATPGYIPGERYVVDYNALSSVLKTSSFVIETQPNGILDAVNVSAEDKSADVLKATVGAALSVATAVGGTALPLGGGYTLQNKSGNSSMFSLGDAKLIPVFAKSKSEAAQLLRQISVSQERFVCTPEAEAALAGRAVAKGARDTAADKLAAANRALAAATVVAGMRRSTTKEVQALADALSAQDVALVADAAAANAFDDAAKPLVEQTTVYWPIDPESRNDVLPTPSGDSSVIAKLIDENRRSIKVVEPKALAVWLGALDPALRAEIIKDNPELKKLVRDDGSPRTDAPDWSDLCTVIDPKAIDRKKAVAKAVDRRACLDKELKVAVALDVGTTEREDCSEQKPVGANSCTIALRDAAVKLPDGKRITGEGRPARDLKLDKGLFVRPPVAGVFRACRGDSAVTACKPDKLLAEERNASVPQLGQLRFLPFQNGMFEAAKMTLDMRDDGSIAKFSYERTKAAGADALGAVKDAVDQYNAYVDKRDTRRSDALKAGRAAAIADLQFEIDMIEKRKALLKAQTPESPDALAAIKDETAALTAETNRLTAQLTKLKAEEALATQTGGGADGR